jgi:hypothetical protein
MRVLLALLLAGLSVPSLASEAAAQPKDAKSSSGKAEFAAGRAKFMVKQYAAALPLFERAYSASQSPNAGLYVGLCLLELKRRPEAFDVLTAVVREAGARKSADPSYEHTFDVATKELSDLTALVGRVTITADNAPADAKITLEGVVISKDRLGTTLAVSPGKVSAIGAAPGRDPVHADVDVAGGELKPLSLRFEAPGVTAGLGRAADSVFGSPFQGMSTLRQVGIATAGVGVVGIGLFAVAGLMANGKFDSLEKSCGGHCSNADVSGGRSLDTVANVGLVVGLVVLAGGGAMIALGGSKSDATSAIVLTPSFAGY